MVTIDFIETGENKKAMSIAKEAVINLTLPEHQFIFRRMVEKGPFGIFMADIKGYLYYVNHAFVSILGYKVKDDVLGANLADVLFKDKEQRRHFLAKLNQTGSVRDYAIKCARHDGIDSVLSVACNFSENDAGAVIGIDGIIQDVTEADQLKEALLGEKSKLEQILDFNELIISIREFEVLVRCIIDRVMLVLEAQKCSVMMLDDKKEALSVVGAKGLDDIIARNTRMELGEPIAGVVADNGHPLLVKNIEYDRKFQRTNRRSYLGRSFMIVPIKIGDKVIGVINVADKKLKNNISKGTKLNYEEAFDEIDLRILCEMSRQASMALENVELFRELNSLAVTDPLVNIFNYRQFSRSLEYEIKRCRRSDIPLCIIMIDIDDFKSYNDSFGHLEGDALLRQLGKIFEEQLRAVDIVCRYAGDEFTIILPDTDINGAKLAASKIQKAVEVFQFLKKVTLSIGIAGYNNELTQHQFILNVDKALYRAKQEGKNRFSVFE